jgi:5-methylcytosine-specific restriction enzyme A
MPNRPAFVCRTPGCPELVPYGLCRKHRREQGGMPERVADKQFYAGTYWRDLRALFLAAHPQCSECSEPSTVADHVVPRKAGGADRWENLRAYCHAHHSARTAREQVREGARWV